MGHMLTKLIFPLPGNKVHCAVFFFFFFFWLQLEVCHLIHFPPHVTRLSSQMGVFATRQQRMDQYTHLGSVQPCLLEAPAVSCEQVHSANKPSRSTESTFILLSLLSHSLSLLLLLPLLLLLTRCSISWNSEPKIYLEQYGDIGDVQRISSKKAAMDTHEIRGNIWIYHCQDFVLYVNHACILLPLPQPLF